MPAMKGLEWTFDTVAIRYEKLRPGYPGQLYEQIFQYIPLGMDSMAMEVGIGAGQATLPILQTGCKVTAVEYGENLAALCREKFAKFKGFSVIHGRFEDVPFSDSQLDLVYSASAFHWIPEEIGYKKVFTMLKRGGAFARFANHPLRSENDPALSREIDGLYSRYYCTYYGKEIKPQQAYNGEQAAKMAALANKYGFVDIQHGLFHRSRVFSAGEYVELLGTYSDHVAMEKSIRTEFFAKIADAIRRHGDRLTISDTIDLQLARKP